MIPRAPKASLQRCEATAVDELGLVNWFICLCEYLHVYVCLCVCICIYIYILYENVLYSIIVHHITPCCRSRA